MSQKMQRQKNNNNAWPEFSATQCALLLKNI